MASGSAASRKNLPDLPVIQQIGKVGPKATGALSKMSARPWNWDYAKTATAMPKAAFRAPVVR